MFLDTPIGFLQIEASEKGLTRVKKVDLPEHTTPGNRIVEECKIQLTEYFSRKRTSFDLPLDFSGKSDFMIGVWQRLQMIPYGCTTSYSKIAQDLDNPSAVRAVGLANKHNPIAIIVPCHRVIGKSGDLTGYFYGLETKRELLELENPKSFAKQGELF
jgi:methylated-DNA-[protein]-cysteine S-methyltransferase